MRRRRVVMNLHNCFQVVYIMRSSFVMNEILINSNTKYVYTSRHPYVVNNNVADITIYRRCQRTFERQRPAQFSFVFRKFHVFWR